MTAALLLALAGAGTAWVVCSRIVLRVTIRGDADGQADVAAHATLWPLALDATTRGTTMRLGPIPLRPPHRWRGAGTPSRSRTPRRSRTPPVRLAIALLRAGHLRVRQLEGDLTYGFADPAVTGELYGLWCSVAPLLDPTGAVRVVPDWSCRSNVRGQLTLVLDAWALGLAVAVARIMLATRRASRPTALPATR